MSDDNDDTGNKNGRKRQRCSIKIPLDMLEHYNDDEIDLDNYEEGYEYEVINKEVNTIDDLIDLGKMYKKKSRKRFNIDLKTLNRLIKPLKKLKKMIGMKKAKKNIVDQILYYLQRFNDVNDNILHTVIYGPPGVGKTELGKILGEIYCEMRILKYSSNRSLFKVFKRSDLIAKYLGQTAIKTQKAIDSCDGGVMFIDEVYSLGHPTRDDMYSKECIDVLNQNLTERKQCFICIIAGYKENVDNCFFKVNPGLERRFPFRLTIDTYNSEELKQIFYKLVDDIKWKIDRDIPTKFFEENKEYFKYNGGDLENLLTQVKITHSRRVFCLDNEFKKKITLEDVKKGMKEFVENREKKVDNKPIPSMYT